MNNLSLARLGIRVTGLWLVYGAISEVTFIELTWQNFRILQEFTVLTERFTRDFYLAVLRIVLQLIPGILFVVKTDESIRFILRRKIDEKSD